MSIQILRTLRYSAVVGSLVLSVGALHAEEIIAPAVAVEKHSDAVIAQTQDAVTLASLSEPAKWRFVQMQLTRGMHDSQSLFNKVGEFVRNHAMLLTMLHTLFVVIPVMTIVSMQMAKNGARWSGPGFFNYDEKFAEIAAGTTLGHMFAFLVTTASVYGLCKLIGGWLENKDEVCLTALGEYLLGWDTYKNQTPTMLHELFDSLATDMHNGGQWAIDKKQARCIVEQVLAVAAIFNTVHA